MTISRIIRAAAPLMAGLGLVGLGTAIALAGAAPSPLPFRCAVFASEQSGMTLLQAVVETDTALAGTYRLAVTSASASGRSQISQGGPFSIASAQQASLGSVTIAANAQADIVFEIETGGTIWSCSPLAA